jgi:hypothetical protein
MLDGAAYRAHFPDDPVYAPHPQEAPRLAHSPALLEALADLEQEFRTILEQNGSSPD